MVERRDAVVKLKDSEEKADLDSARGVLGFIYASTNERRRLRSKREPDCFGQEPPQVEASEGLAGQAQTREETSRLPDAQRSLQTVRSNIHTTSSRNLHVWGHLGDVDPAVRLPPRPQEVPAGSDPSAEPSGVGVVLEQLDHVPQPVPELRSAAHLGQHAEEVRVRDPFPGDVGQQVGVVGRLAQDDLGVVRVEVHLE